jgi:hypothetical protein
MLLRSIGVLRKQQVRRPRLDFQHELTPCTLFTGLFVWTVAYAVVDHFDLNLTILLAFAAAFQ